MGYNISFYYIFFWFFLSFFISIILGVFFIPILAKIKLGQSILNIGPSWHKNKNGTPTMGGLIFIFSTVLLSLLPTLTNHFKLFNKKKIWIVLGISLLYAGIGFFDDLIKVKFKRNLGLSSLQKFALQIISSVLFLFLGFRLGLIDSKIILPFCGRLNLGALLFVSFAIFVMVGTANAVNLTDGIDGLAASVTFVVSASMFALSKILFEIECSFLFLILSAAMLGFFVFNKNPARVFMGDTGSLFIGGFLSCAALLMRLPIFLFILGIIYVVETLSVILQVVFFKFRGKRLFKMSPLHHHFEMIGYSEKKIVTLFCLITFIMSILSIYLIRFCF